MPLTTLHSLFTNDQYSVPEQQPGRFRGRPALRALHTASETAVRIVLLDGQGLDREQIKAEVQALAKADGERVAVPIDLLANEGAMLALAYRQLRGVPIGVILERKGAALGEEVALAIIREAIRGMEELHGSEVAHRFIDVDSVFVLGQERVVLTDVIPAGLAHCFQPTAWLYHDLFQPDHQRDEQLADRYALGVVLLAMLSQGFTQLVAGGETYREHLCEHGFDDHLDHIERLSRPTRDVLGCLLNKDPALRYSDDHSIYRDVVRALSGYSARIAKKNSTSGRMKSDPAHSDFFNTADIQGHLHKEEEARPVTEPRIERKALKSLARMVVVDQRQLKASINLAPGASFPRGLLLTLLKESRVTFGIRDGAIDEATIPKEEVRHLVLAQGIEPQPGVVGRSVRDEEIPALEASLKLQPSVDHMSVELLSVPGEPIPKSTLTGFLAQERVQVGIDDQALERLASEGAGESGRTLVARGKPPVPARDYAFHLCTEEGRVADDPDRLQYRAVKKGAVVARWLQGETGIAGSTCFGEELEVADPEQNDPSSLAGEGLELMREHKEIFLQAVREGVVSREPNGRVNVVGVQTIRGDVPPGNDLDSDDLILIEGDVPDGITVNSRVGIIVKGSVGDAELVTGGDCRVHGAVAAGEREIHVAGLLRAGSISGRSVIAGGLVVEEEMADTKAVVLGDVRVGTVPSGSVVAAGSITIEEAGGAEAEVELWAGHHVPHAISKEMAQLEEKKLVAERGRMVGERNEIFDMLGEIKRNEYRFTVGGYIQKHHLQQIQDRLTRIKVRSKFIDEALEEAREVIVDKKEVVRDLHEAADDSGARINVAHAHTGIVVRLARAEARKIEQSQEGLHHQLRR